MAFCNTTVMQTAWPCSWAGHSCFEVRRRSAAACAHLTMPAAAFRKLGDPQTSSIRAPRAQWALTKRRNRLRDANCSSSAATVSRRASPLGPASVLGVAAPLLALLASNLPQHTLLRGHAGL